jgi:alkylation response protein AidB-like acyl-CoA dehydrogenase
MTLTSQALGDPRRGLFSADHQLFRDTVCRFLERDVLPYHAQWERDGLIPRDTWRKAGAAGILLPMTPVEYGGGGGDFLNTAIVVEEIARVLATGLTGFSTHSDIVSPYLLHFGSEALKKEWLPRMASGDCVGSIAMTEPSAGSDLKAIRTTARRAGQGWRIDGQKTFITNGFHADRVLVVAKTDPQAGAKGMSLFWVDARAPGFVKGQPLDKIGHRAQDTVELFFDGVLVPESDMVGEENKAFSYLMHELAQERLMIALRCAISLEASLEWTIAYTRQRSTFGKPLIENRRFAEKIADLEIQVTALEFTELRVLSQMAQGGQPGPEVSGLKIRGSEIQQRITELTMEAVGEYAAPYLPGLLWRGTNEEPVGPDYAHLAAPQYFNHRKTTIYGGSNEIQKGIISKMVLGL